MNAVYALVAKVKGGEIRELFLRRNEDHYLIVIDEVLKNDRSV